MAEKSMLISYYLLNTECKLEVWFGLQLFQPPPLLKSILFIAKGLQSPTICSGQSCEVEEMRTFLRHEGKVILFADALDRVNKNLISFAVGSIDKKILSYVQTKSIHFMLKTYKI